MDRPEELAALGKKQINYRNLPDRMFGWVANLEVWWLFGFIGSAVMGACLAVTGTEPGMIDPRFKFVWVVAGAFCLSLTQGVRTLEKRKVLQQLGAAGEAQDD